MELVRMHVWAGWPVRAAELARQTSEDARAWAPDPPEDCRRLRADIAEVPG
ncbi:MULTISPECIES: hypothetical protein [unclassified Streptomyces]|uniref:hypothetical protein n=1 Tax=unclassified Streptomyces TaxID=2593676 RepID=UPI003317B8FB